MKIKYIKYLWRLLKREVQFEIAKDNPLLTIRALQEAGVDIPDDAIIADPRTFKVDLTRPSLIKIGHSVRINANFEILTHDAVTMVFRKAYHDFIPSSGKVTIGNNVCFARNVAVLKGSDIGDNCFIGYGSVVMGKIPANSIAAGCPAKVICTLEEYYERRKKKCINEAFEYARSIQERLHRRPVPADFWEEFPLFVSNDQIEQYPDIPIKEQLGMAYPYWKENHQAPYISFEDFLQAAGIR